MGYETMSLVTNRERYVTSAPSESKQPFRPNDNDTLPMQYTEFESWSGFFRSKFNWMYSSAVSYSRAIRTGILVHVINRSSIADGSGCSDCFSATVDSRRTWSSSYFESSTTAISVIENLVIRVQGQIWKAETTSGAVNEGESVEIVGREGLILRVKPKQSNVKV